MLSLSQRLLPLSVETNRISLYSILIASALLPLSLSCGVKGPPLAPLPVTPQQSDSPPRVPTTLVSPLPESHPSQK